LAVQITLTDVYDCTKRHTSHHSELGDALFFYRDVLFGRLYDRFAQDVIAHGAFLECLEPYILDNQVNNDLFNQILQKAFPFQEAQAAPGAASSHPFLFGLGGKQ